MPSSLYIHIPFCKKICTYCDFPKLIYAQDWAFSYVNGLIKDISLLKNEYETIYIGGGTPTSLSLDLLDPLLKALRMKLKEGGEFSIESNPDSLNEETIDCLLKNGVNRLSIGIQTSLDEYLSYLGRTHNFIDAKEAVESAKRKGFENINVDMMYGFSSQTQEELEEDLNNFLSLNVPHISAYGLIIEEGTILKNEHIREETDLQGEYYDIIVSFFRKHGYKRYEVSNFAKEGYECKHNLTYWKDEEYDALGLGASGYANNVRYTYTKSLSSYMRGKAKSYEEKIGKDDDVKYFLTTNLRLEDGFELETFFIRFGFRFEERYKKEIEKFKREGLLSVDGIRCKATDKGMVLLDRILLEFY